MLDLSIDSQLVIEIEKRSAHKHAFHLEVDHSELAVRRFLTLVTAGHTVIMSSSERFADRSYLELIAHEAQTDFILWPLNRSIAELDLSSQKCHPLIKGKGMFIVRTSGTSGQPFKLVLHDLSCFLDKFRSTEKSYEHILLFFPLDSIAGIETVLECYAKGSHLSSLQEKPNPENLWQELVKGKIDFLHLTPSFLSQMMLAGFFRTQRHRSSRKSCSALNLRKRKC